MKASPIITNFTSGELSPYLDGRVDISRYYNGAKTLENFIILPQGGIRRRPGTYYVASTKNNGIARLIPFQFSTTQSYILEFGDQYMRVYKDNGQVEAEGGGTYELATPYLEADLFDLQFAQDADMMFIVHPSYKPQELTRTAHNSWSIDDYDPAADPFGADDSDALEMLKGLIQICFVTADHRGFLISRKRTDDMGFPLYLIKMKDRLQWIKEEYGLSETIYMGDGILDPPIFEEVGYSICPADGFYLAREKASYVGRHSGGCRAVAEACIHIKEKFFV